MNDEKLEQLSRQVAELAMNKGLMLATAESCTGGWLAKLFTDVAGSSKWFDRGFVTYSNEAKQEMLGVLARTLEQHGAVSQAVVEEMVAGALLNSKADIAVAVSGIAGPGGGSAEKPVGTVWFAWKARGGAVVTKLEQFEGDRDQVRRQSVACLLEGIAEQIG